MYFSFRNQYHDEADVENVIASSKNPVASLSSYKPFKSDHIKNFSFEDDYAVQTKNIKFGYQKNFIIYKSKMNLVLNNCSINVPKGSIYALLGSSGCGKTSLLKCILGRLTPESGKVRVFGRKPSHGTGYMPQELALFGEFSIEETLTYFGHLHKMSQSMIEERTDFLIQLLSLPKKTRIIYQLSGGQQRRVSMAVALLHKPALAILDEPTVGLDPLLRKKIWDYLAMITMQDNMTVIITTHYIEEARCADVVGLMRGGKLIQENNPDLLLAAYKCKTLEDVFLKVCQQIDMVKRNSKIEIKNNVDDDIVINNEKPIQNGVNFKNGINRAKSYGIDSNQNLIEKNRYNSNYHKSRPYIDVQLIIALFTKNWIALRGNRLLLLMYFLPSLQFSFFAVSVGRDPISIPVAIFNEEKPEQFTKSYLDKLNKDMILQIRYNSLDEAVDSIRKGDSWFAFHFHHKFTESLKTRTEDAAFATNETISESNIHLYADMSNAVIAISIFRAVLVSFLDFMKNVLAASGYNSNSIALPIEVKEVIYGSSGIEPSLMEWMAPGTLIALIFFAPLALTGFALIKERKEGLLERSLVAGVRAEEVIVSHFILQSIVLAIQVILLMMTTFVLWEIPYHGNLLETATIIFLQGVSGIGFGLLISSVCADEVTAMVIGSAVVFPSWCICGTFWPIDGMGQIAKSFTYFLPLTLPLEALRCIVERGWDITYFPVFVGFFVCGVYIFIFVFLSIIFFRILV